MASGLYRGVSSLGTLLYGSHLVMVGWVASLVVTADGAASTELSSLSCELFYLYMTYVLLCAVRLCFCRVYV